MNEKLKQFLKRDVLPFVVEFAVLALILRFVVAPTYVPTGSMIPAIMPGDVLVSLRMYNPLSKVERGNVLSFYSQEMDKVLIKRVIGLPGERVEILEDGTVTINGTPLEEPYILNQAEGYTGVYQVPANSFFFLGDNRSSSEDARFWENPFIEEQHILSKAVFTMWPLSQFGMLK